MFARYRIAWLAWALCSAAACATAGDAAEPRPDASDLRSPDASQLAAADARVADAAPADALVAATVTLGFPDVGDTLSPSHGWLWELGSFVEGTRSTPLPSTTHLDAALVISDNVLFCDTQDMAVKINGIQVGTFMIGVGELGKTLSLSFPPVAGPDYTLRLENIREVGFKTECGSARFDQTGAGSVTLSF